MTPVRPRSRVKHSTTELLRSQGNFVQNKNVSAYCSVGTIPEEPSEAGVAGVIGVIGPPGPGVEGYKLALDGGITGLGVGPSPKEFRVPGDIRGL